MKNRLWVLVFLLSCDTEPDVRIFPVRQDALAPVRPGGFISTDKKVSGYAKISYLGGKYFLVLEDFSTEDGPDLHLLLAKNASPEDAIDLGKLKSKNGTQLYAIAGTPDFEQYTYAHIYSVSQRHLYGTALLR